MLIKVLLFRCVKLIFNNNNEISIFLRMRYYNELRFTDLAGFSF